MCGYYGSPRITSSTPTTGQEPEFPITFAQYPRYISVLWNTSFATILTTCRPLGDTMKL
ncbi:hypothetical protein C8Q74DRAFT_379515 [Fomes fomentarius]|nr:hypothetical protein C8Q74DRAFT_379515 [Fomes fomentarius]